MFKAIATAIVLAASLSANAASYYFVNGKPAANQAEAKRAGLKDPKAKIVKIQATVVQMNEETLNLKKSSDISLQEVKALIK